MCWHSIRTLVIALILQLTAACTSNGEEPAVVERHGADPPLAADVFQALLDREPPTIDPPPLRAPALEHPPAARTFDELRSAPALPNRYPLERWLARAFESSAELDWYVITEGACEVRKQDLDGEVREAHWVSYEGTRPVAGFSDQDGDGVVDVRQRYTYDDRGRLIREVEEYSVWTDDCESMQKIVEHAYDPYGHRVITKANTWGPMARRDSTEQRYSYDADGRLSGIFVFDSELGRLERAHFFRWSGAQVERVDTHGPDGGWVETLLITRVGPVSRADWFRPQGSTGVVWDRAEIFEQRDDEPITRAELHRLSDGEVYMDSELRVEFEGQRRIETLHQHYEPRRREIFEPDGSVTTEVAIIDRSGPEPRSTFVHESRAIPEPGGHAMVRRYTDEGPTIYRYECDPFIPKLPARRKGCPNEG